MTTQPIHPIHPKAVSASFLPADYVARRSTHRAVVLSLVLFGIIMSGVIGAFFVTTQRWGHINDERRVVDAEHAKERAKLEQLKLLEAQQNTIMEKAEITAALVEQINRSLLMQQIVDLMPGDVTLVEVNLKSKRIDPSPPAADPKAKAPAKVKTLTGGKASPAKTDKDKKDAKPEIPTVKAPRFEYTLAIIGVAADNANITDYMQGLSDCPLLTRVDLLYIKDTSVKEMSLRKFEIQAQLNDSVDLKTLERLRTESAAKQAAAPPLLTPSAAAPDAASPEAVSAAPAQEP